MTLAIVLLACGLADIDHDLCATLRCACCCQVAERFGGFDKFAGAMHELTLVPDAGAQGWALTPDPPFTVDADTGAVKVSAPLDREQAAAYIIGLRAANGKRTGSAVAAVSVVDENDNSPEFGALPGRVSIAEGTHTSSAIAPNMHDSVAACVAM